MYGDRRRPIDVKHFEKDSIKVQSVQAETCSLQRLVDAYREHGHKKAILDPLRLKEISSPLELNPVLYGLSFDDNRRYNAHEVLKAMGTDASSVTLSEMVAILEDLYCSPVAVQFQHLSTAEERSWFACKFEQSHKDTCSERERILLAKTLLKAQAFDQFVASKFAGVKRYGGEGAEGAILICDQLFQLSAQKKLSDVVVCIAHRGRLNLLVCLLQYPPATVFRKMKGRSEFPADVLAAGDVLSHLSMSVDLDYDGDSVHVTLLPNTSHLEAVNPVAVGKARGREWLHSSGSYATSHDSLPSDRVLTLQIHGDAAFVGQGIVAETFALADEPHFTVGGSIHLIINNQIGYTTEANKSNTGQYCSDIGKLHNCPIIHVNGDYPEEAVRAARLAMEYRETFHKDVLIDYVCFRRWGHNEMDEPAFTQPVMYDRIRARPSIPDRYAQQLVDQEICSRKELEDEVTKFRSELQDGLQNLDLHDPKANHLEKHWSGIASASPDITTWDTGVDKQLLRFVGNASVSYPDGLAVHETLKKSHVDRRKEKLLQDEAVDWATAEALAIGSLLYQGFSVRLSGQDVGRGTFSQRHATLIDQNTGNVFIPLNTLAPNQTAFLEVANSILSEEAVLAFEFGMSIASPKLLNIWEAQFGDFFNGAQIIIDGFVTGAETKWLLQSGLVMLLPHGIDGTGPEHSSCRIERFLQLCDSYEDRVDGDNVNLQIANPTTPAQYFHLLRRQMVRNFRKPLMIAAPKVLLRHPDATSYLGDMSPGTHIKPVLPDSVAVPSEVRKVVFVCGQHYYSLNSHRQKKKYGDTAVVRIEVLCPFPANEIRAELEKYPNAKDYIWSQEEHRNQGAWSFVAVRFHNILGIKLRYAGRDVLATPAVGIGSVHQMEAQKILQETFA